MEKTSFEFSFDKDVWLKGYEIYNRLYRKRKKIIYTAVFGVLALLFLQQIIMNPSYGVGWVCMAISLGVVAAVWLNPLFERKKIEPALDALKDDKYSVSIYDNKYTVKTILPESDNEFLEVDENGERIPLEPIPETSVSFEDKDFKAVITDELIGMFTANTQCIIPKKCLDEEKIKLIEDLLKDRIVK